MSDGGSACWLTLSDLPFEPASFRDPAGRVVEKDGRILRVLAHRGSEEFRWLRDRGVLDALTQSGRLVATREIDAASVGLDRPQVQHVLEHARVPFLSYPYEWPFAALQAAALLQLDLHLDLLERGATLIDASAYNVQFLGTRPLFIDVLSLRRYREGALWAGHRQFCEQFLNPLLLQARRGIPFNRWYRGTMDGISVEDLAALLTWRDRASWRVVLHIVAQAKLQRAAQSGRLKTVAVSRTRTLPKASLVGLLKGLRTWIARLTPRASRLTGWTTYTRTHTYGAEEVAAKRQFVAEFVAAYQPDLLLDVGCNTGDYAAVALDAGARAVVGLEADAATADQAFRRAASEQRNFLPLVMDAADPSPSQGWRERERRSLSSRASFDALIALAFVHHLALARNVPLDQLVAWLVGLAPRGVIEFVPKDDPTARQMLALREDVFDEYGPEHFMASLMRHARIVREATVSATGRVLFWYERA